MSLYRHLGVAIALSPRADALLAEVAHRAPGLASRLSLIHAGAHTPEKEDRLRAAMRKAGLDAETEIFWESGAPDEAILRAVQTHAVDLLLAGALEKEQPLRYFLGSVARDLVRDAPCSLMLFTEPKLTPEPLRRIVVVTDYSEQSLIALTRAIRFAEREESEQIMVIRVLSDYGDAMILSEGVRRERASTYRTTSRANEQELLQNLVDAAGHSRVPIKAECIEGHVGFAAAQFAREKEADLLVMSSSSGHSHFFERIFPSDMEWVLREIPCNLWVVRVRMT